MKVFKCDLVHAQFALCFMLAVSNEAPTLERVTRAKHDLSDALDKLGQDASEESFDLSEKHALADVLLEHGHLILNALDEHRHEWQKLARTVSAKKGYIPPLMLEESGNAYAVARELCEAAEFLNAAIIQLGKLRHAKG